MKGILLAVIAAAIIITVQMNDFNESQTETLCHENILFVKFNTGYSSWGTFMPDENGKPIHCSK